MSILPSRTDQQGSASSSPAFTNPSNHGSLPQQQQPQSPLSSTNGALGISESDASTSTAAAVSVLEALTPANNSKGSFIKVTGSESLNVKNRHPRSSAGRNHYVPVGKNESSQPNSGTAVGSTGSPPNHRNSGSTGRRPQMVNGNHLLNFHYDPITRPQLRVGTAPIKPRSSRKVKAYNKDLFVQANYKFVVLDDGNYDPVSMDPDKMLQWEDIICVKYSTPYPVTCPICLETPLCPQITSCGHIFCFPCILQYLLMGEENLKQDCWKKCPLCFMMISSKEMYTIHIEHVKHYHIGDTLEFTLLGREKDNFSLHPRNHEGNTVQCDQFSKFILTSDAELSVRNAISDLDNWLVRADSGLVDDLEKLPYVCAALEQLEKRKNYWKEHRVSGCLNGSENVGCKELKCERTRSVTKVTGAEIPASASGIHNSCANNTKLGIVDSSGHDALSSETEKLLGEQDYSSPSSHVRSKTGAVQSCGSRSVKEKEYYSFYQVVDGQNIILHPLNMKCLLHHFGSYDQLPPRVGGRILELEAATQSDAIRRRFRYLSHFPLTATFQFCEIDLSGTLPAESLSPFSDQIKKREKQRKQLAKKEQREKVKAEAVIGYYVPPSSFSQSFHDHEPAFSMDDFEALGSDTSAITVPPVYGERSLFSNVARMGFAAAHDSPSLNNNEPSTGMNMGSTSSSSTPAGSSIPGVTSFASVISRSAKEESPDVAKVKVNETKKGKKGGRVLLSNAGIRRY